MNRLQKWIAGRLLGIKAVGTGQRYSIVNGKLVTMADKKSAYIDEAYSVNDVVYSVVNLILDKVRIAPWGLYKIADESSLKQYKGLIGRKDISPDDFRRIRDLKKKALEPLDKFDVQSGKLNELLKWANDYETFSDMVTSGCGYKLITGDRYLWGDVLNAGANKGLPNSLWNLPSQDITIVASNTFPAREVGYKMMSWALDYPKEEVMHEKYWNPQWGISDQHLHGMSPLKAAARNITRNNAAKDASNAKFQNNGIEAVIYTDDDRLDGQMALDQAVSLKQKLISEYTGPKNQGKLAVSGYKVGVANIGLTPVELGIIESEKWDMRMICNIFGVPSQLMNDPENKTYNNQKEGEKALTSRSAIPLLTSFRDNFNRKLQTDWGFKGKNVFVDYDVCVYTELQQDLREIAEWSNMLIGITPNEQRDLMGLEMVDDEIMNEIWLKMDREPLSERNMNEVDDALNNGAGNNNSDVDEEDV